jgi:hypothetical protein
MGKNQTIAAMRAYDIAVPQVLVSLKDGERLLAQSSANIGRYFVGR